jgi:hypothetical protein
MPDEVHLHVCGYDHWRFRHEKVMRKDLYGKLVKKPV